MRNLAESANVILAPAMAESVYLSKRLPSATLRTDRERTGGTPPLHP